MTLRSKTTFSLLFAPTLALAQQQRPAPEFPSPPPRQVSDAPSINYDVPPPNIGELMRANNGSLYRASVAMPADPRLIQGSDVNFFAVDAPKPRVVLKHDLLTIVVREQSESSSEGSTDTKKNADFKARVEEFPSINLSDFVFKPGVGSIKPEISISGERSYKGEGTVDRKDTLITRIQAEVVDVKPNGTLVLQARKQIVTDEEHQTLVLTGICRVQDITPDNSVLSTQLYDLNVRKTHTGAVHDATRRGWVPRAIDWLNPF